MASVTLATLKARVLDRADMTGSSFIDDTQLTVYINDAISELWDLLIGTFQDYFLKTQTLTLTSGTDTYDLQTVFTSADFYKLVKAFGSSAGEDYPLRQFKLDDYDLSADTTGLVTRYRIMGDDIIFSPVPNASETIKAWYIPTPTELSADGDTLTISSIPNGWVEYVVLAAAIRCLLKEESDTSGLEKERDRVWARIIETAPRDHGEPRRMRDVFARRL
jgi:hypothetical protein